MMRLVLRAQAPDGLPGTRARLQPLVLVYFLGFVACIMFLEATIWLTVENRGHLRSPLLEWAFATPFGIFTFAAVALLVIGLPLVLMQWRLGITRAQLAQAPDMTDAAPDDWERVFVQRSRASQPGRWLGHDRWEWRVNRGLLALAFLLLLGILAVWIAAIVYALPAALSVRCGNNGCVPIYPVWMVEFASGLAAITGQFVAANIWIGRVERACGIWLRHRRAVVEFSKLCYIRRPGVSAEQAAQAIRRYVPATRRPAAPGCLLTLLAFIPYCLIPAGCLFLSAWLRLQWVP